MPAYGTNPPVGVYVGDQAVVWNDRRFRLNGKSQAIALGTTGSAHPATLRAQVDFNASPGTFEVDLQESDNDIDANYQTVANVAATVGAPTYSCYIQYVNPTGKFYRLFLKAFGTRLHPGRRNAFGLAVL